MWRHVQVFLVPERPDVAVLDVGILVPGQLVRVGVRGQRVRLGVRRGGRSLRRCQVWRLCVRCHRARQLRTVRRSWRLCNRVPWEQMDTISWENGQMTAEIPDWINPFRNFWFSKIDIFFRNRFSLWNLNINSNFILNSLCEIEFWLWMSSANARYFHFRTIQEALRIHKS